MTAQDSGPSHLAVLTSVYASASVPRADLLPHRSYEPADPP
jgi:hypothetical protein